MILEKSDIRHILPQAEPFLLIDRAEITEASAIRAEVFLDPAWEIFQAHFPGYALLPGVYLAESMAQTADLLLLTRPGNQEKLPLFLGISRMRFLRPAYPGDTLILSAAIKQEAGSGMYDCRVSASIHGKTAAAGEISLALKEHP